MRIVAVSDLHGYLPEIPTCDVLVIAGDLCPETQRFVTDPDLTRMFQHEWLESEYKAWERSIPAGRIVMTPGNHDRMTRMPEGFRTEWFVDEGVTIQGLKFWFSPWIPFMGGNWNYEAIPRHRAEAFQLIPEGLDVLVTHAPAKWEMDTNYAKEHCGCQILSQVIKLTRPRYHLFGHIHEGQRYGREKVIIGNTVSINCARFLHDWKPVVIEL